MKAKLVSITVAGKPITVFYDSIEELEQDVENKTVNWIAERDRR